MATFLSTVSDNIKQLRTRLSEYAFGDHGLAVLKELIQNADDARASRLEFLLFDKGFPEANNPLLRGPALLVFNDGPFERAHERMFTQPAGTSKNRDATAIGRFGIGQQSLFHLCEAWFYLGMAPRDPTLLGDVIDPWADPAVSDPSQADMKRPEWNVFDQADRARVLGALGNRKQARGWLALWLPLRQEEHRRNPGGYISNRVWSSAQIAADVSDLSPLVAVIPQLHTLSEIRFHRAAAPMMAGRVIASVGLSSGSTRLDRPRPGSALRARGSGEVVLQIGDQEAISYQFLLHQHTVEDTTLGDLVRNPSWPTVPIDEDGETREVPEKVVPHGAITVLRGPPARADAAWPPAGVSIGWAIYLPIGKPECGQNSTGGEDAWSLLLHGAFFPDHGRRWPLGFDSLSPAAPDPAALRRGDPDPRLAGTSSTALDEWFRLQWNSHLRDAATLPLLLPILAEALRTRDIQEAEGVLCALMSTELVRNLQAVAGRHEQIVVLIERSGPVVRLRPRDRRVMKIPRTAPGSAAWTRVVVPVIDALAAAEQVLDLTFDDAPRIAADPPSRWTDAALTAALVDNVIQGIGRSPEAVTWLAQWLSDIAKSEASLVTQHVLGVLARAVRFLGEENLRHASVREEWARIASLLPSSHRVATSAHRAIEITAPAFQSVVLLPEELMNTDSTARPIWSDAEWRSALRLLSAAVFEGVTKQDEALVKDCGQLAGEIVSSVGARIVSEDPSLQELALFRVHSIRHREKQFVSAVYLFRMRERSLAFARSGLVSPESACQRLFAAIDGSVHDILLLEDAKIAAVLGVPDLSETALLECFSRGDLTPAADTRARRDLLDTVLTKRMVGVSNTEFGPFRAAVRWLLTGDRRAKSLALELLVRESAMKLDERLCRDVLAMRDRAWTLLSPLVAGMLTQDWKDRLGVRSLREEDPLQCLREASDEALDRLCGSMERVQMETVSRFTARDETLWRRLQVHETSKGARVAAGGKLFREEQAFPVPEVLRPKVHILVPARDVEAAALQRLRVPAWSAHHQVSMGLELAEQGVPETAVPVARAILDGLVVLPTWSAVDRLSSVAWLPTLSRRQVAPGELLSLPASVAECVRGLLRGDEEVFVLPEEVDDGCRAHAVFPRVSALGAGEPRAAVDALGLRLAQLPDEVRVDLCLASQVCDLPPEELVSKSLATSRHRGLALVRVVRAEIDGDVPTELRHALCGTFTEGQHAALLKWFGDAARSRGDDGDVEERLLRHYLTLLAPGNGTDQRRHSVLSTVTLKSAAGTWTPAARLTVAPNVSDDYRLDELQAAALRLRAEEEGGLRQSSVLPTTHPGVEVTAAASVLEAHFREWSSSPIPIAALGALAALLGDGVCGSVREIASRWLGAHATVEHVREELVQDWSVALSTATDIDHRILDHAQLGVISTRDGERVEVVSLLGEPLIAEVGGSGPVRTLLVRPLQCTDTPQWLVLRSFDPGTRSSQELLDILRKTIDDVFVGLTRHRPGPGIERLWQRLRPEAQVDVEVVRGQIRRELGAQLRNLGCSAESGEARELSVRLRELRRCEQRLDELDAEDARCAGESPQRAHLRNRARGEHEAARSALEKLVEEDTVTIRFLLGRVRRQLEKAQYGPERVPFELFQNADDAVVQLERMLSAEERVLPEACRSFEVQIPGGEGQTIRFWHWGRSINRHYLGPAFKSGRELGFDRDLLHMMLLHASDKGEQGGTTGQFGLGFKAVHLVSDAPKVQSERIAFEVRAGFIPVPTSLTPEWTKRRIDDFLPTVVDLPVSAELSTRSITSRFEEYGGLLPVFAQAIREVALQGASTRTQSSWSPRVLALGGPRVEVGEVRIDLSRSENTRLLVVRRQEGGGPLPAAVFVLSGGRVDALGEHVPTYWTTAPTDVRCATGWCINGPFAVDVGRTQLGQTDQHRKANLAVAESLGGTVKDALVALYDAIDAKVPTVSAALGLPVGNMGDEAKRFWTTLWSRLTAGMSNPAEHDEIAGTLTRAWTGYVRTRHTLPTGLEGAWYGLTRLEDVRFVADDALGRPEVARTVTAWPWVLSRWPAGQVVCREVASTLGRLHGTTPAPLTLAMLVDAAHAGVHPVPILTLCALAPVYRWLNDDEQPLPREERERVRDSIANLPLVNAACKARPAAELLIPALGNDTRGELRERGGSRAAEDIDLLMDDARLAAFAIADRLLSPDLVAIPDVLLLYLEGRRRRKTPIDIDEVASWVHVASEPSARKAALRYLVEGERRGPLASVLHGCLPAWSASEPELVASGLLDELSHPQQISVKIALFGPPATVTWNPELPPPVPPPRQAVGTLLRRIAHWWADTRQPIEAHWEEKVYPQWLPADQLKPRLIAQDDEAWLLLLSLGVCQRVGRTQPGAAQAFIDRLRTFQWWPEMVSTAEAKPWIVGLEGWLTSEAEHREFDRWIELLPWIWQARRWLDDYRRVLLNAHKTIEGRGVMGLWRPGTNPVLEGTDIDPPPFNALTSVGGRWVLRELLRKEVVPATEALRRASFVPHLSTRRFLNELGLALDETGNTHDASERISDFLAEHLLDDPTFGGTYDLPLHILSRHPVLRERALTGDLRPGDGADSIDHIEPEPED